MELLGASTKQIMLEVVADCDVLQLNLKLLLQTLQTWALSILN